MGGKKYSVQLIWRDPSLPNPETSPHLILLFIRMLWHCFAVKLQKSFVDYKTSPGLPSIWGWVDNDRNFIFWSTYPLMKMSKFLDSVIVYNATSFLLFLLYLQSNTADTSPSLIRGESMVN